MMRLVFLDTGPLGLLANAAGKPRVDECDRWADSLLAAGVLVFVPEVADYEVRRKLIHTKATASLRRLDRLSARFDYSPITTEVMHRAAELWAYLRGIGRSVAAPDALGGDCILAAQALTAAGLGDTVTVATDNVRHLGLMVDAQPWETITG